MLALHTILHPTDFSENAHTAFRVACALARDYRARLVVVHVTPPQTLLFTDNIVPPRHLETAQALRDKLQQLHPAPSHVAIEHRLTVGDPATEILVTAEEIKCDVIIMGTHGHRGLTHLLMGSVAEQIIRRAACPVVTVKLPVPAHLLPEEATGAAAHLETRARSG